ncbi:interferon-induced 35 kDa protein isoform X1 [Anolis carolinensis]|uniref:interferon-induced 35 kDa protein isoform X1 n=1 Tax=Anolis carolinensis TaxID=28377 RepID=UPI002F2B48AE
MTESDEDSFIYLPNDSISSIGFLETMEEQTAREIKRYQDILKALEIDHLSLESSREQCEQEASRYQEAAESLHTKLLEYEDQAKAQKLAFQKEIERQTKERNQLLQEKEALEKELEQIEKLSIAKESLHKVDISLPERSVVFKGHAEEAEKEQTLPDPVVTQPQVRCPIPGGSALITFEDPEVANRIIEMGQHRVQLDECTYVNVKAEPMTLLLLASVEISVARSSRQVLLSGLPMLSVPEDKLLDKLELFFSKRQNQGGEVERVERLSGSGHVALTFVEDGVVERLVQRGRFQIPIGKEKHEIKVSHYVSGEITDFQFRPSVCDQTVLLSGIPDVLDEELMRETLEIHFQKPSKGGGEVEAVVYVPTGVSAAAVFEEAKTM